jgi:outer membrane receptor for ferrienterochelin and colicins
MCIGGYRFDHNTSYGDSHTGRISTICNSGNFTLKALFSTGYRAPTAWELFNETRQRRENRSLDPERMWSVETGVAYTIPQKGHLAVQGYYNVIRDIILEVETTDLNPNPEKTYWNQNQNIGKADIVGLEFTSDYCVRQDLTVYLNYTFSEGEYRDMPDTLISPSAAHHDNDIPNIPTHSLNTGITYHMRPDISWHIRSNYLSEITTIGSNPQKKTDDQLLFHTTIRWENVVMQGLCLQLLVRNLFDNNAFDPGIRTADGTYYPTLHPVEGRNIWFTVAHHF